MTGGQKRIFTWEQNTAEDVQTILGRGELWYEDGGGRLEIINRVKMWRFLSGDENFDVHYWLTRLENMPERRLVA